MATKTKQLTSDQFLALPRSEQRIAIAKDVLAQLAAGTLTADNGEWGKIHLSNEIYEENDGLDVDLRDLLQTKDTTCTACAMGSCFFSMIRLTDDLFVKVDDYTLAIAGEVSLERHELFRKIFVDDFELLEYTFENGGGVTKTRHIDAIQPRINADWESFTLKEYCFGFHRVFEDPNDRLEAMMKNVIRNRGSFKPWKNRKTRDFLRKARKEYALQT